MVFGMNQRALKEKRGWRTYLWPRKRHWALVLQPLGDSFTARAVDDFMHNPQQCCNVDCSSENFFLVYELLVEDDRPFPMLSLKLDFDCCHDSAVYLGEVPPLHFAELADHALGVISRFKRYSFIGANCQHFAFDFAMVLGVPLQTLPEDEACMLKLSDGAETFLTASVVAAAATGTALAGVSVLGAGGTAVTMLIVAGAASSAAGFVGSLSFMGLAVYYKAFRDGLRLETIEDLDCPQKN
jgi:hypothetical protein